MHTHIGMRHVTYLKTSRHAGACTHAARHQNRASTQDNDYILTATHCNALQHTATHCYTHVHAHTQLDIKTGLAQEIMDWRATVFVQPLPPKIVKQTEQLLKRCSRDNVEDLATLTTSPQVLAAACVQVPRSPRVAVCCSVLQCVAVCCSVLQCVAGCRSVLQCLAVLFAALVSLV